MRWFRVKKCLTRLINNHFIIEFQLCMPSVLYCIDVNEMSAN